MLKGLALTPPVVGRISIGKVVETLLLVQIVTKNIMGVL